MSTSPSAQIDIRTANPDDAADIVRVHQEAVHLTAAQSYENDILQYWSSRSPGRIEKLRLQLLNNECNSQMFVAEINGNVVGFSEVSLATNEVRAVYVSPAAGRQGIGKQLLERLELFAQENGLKELWLDASLNAAKFYTANGFTVDAPGEHTLSSGRKMACIKMRKIL